MAGISPNDDLMGARTSVHAGGRGTYAGSERVSRSRHRYLVQRVRPSDIWRRVVCKPSAQPTLVRTQHPPPRIPSYITRNSIDTIESHIRKATVSRTVVFRTCGRVTVRFARNIPTDPSKRLDRSRLVCGRTPSDRSKIRNSWDIRGMDHEPSRRHTRAQL